MKVNPDSFRVAPSSGVPIFRQIIDQVTALVATGKLRPGDMLPSTRALARQLLVTTLAVGLTVLFDVLFADHA